MAITLYPLENYDGFTDVAYCDTFLTNNVIGSQRALYDALSTADKEIYIRQATTLIKQKIDLPDTLEDDLQNATCYLVNYSISIDMLNTDLNSNIKKEVIAQSEIETEYFSPSKGANQFPNIVADLLSQYGYSSGGAFKFQRA